MKGGDPFGAVFSPDEHAVTLPNAAGCQQRGKPPGKVSQIAVGGDAAAVALVAHDGDLAVKATKIVDQRSQMLAHNASGKFMVAA